MLVRPNQLNLGSNQLGLTWSRTDLDQLRIKLISYLNISI